MREPGDSEDHCPPPERPPRLLELERRVVATILAEPRAVRALRRPLCPWCAFSDPRNALLVACALRGRRPVGLQPPFSDQRARPVAPSASEPGEERAAAPADP